MVNIRQKKEHNLCSFLFTCLTRLTRHGTNIFTNKMVRLIGTHHYIEETKRSSICIYSVTKLYKQPSSQWLLVKDKVEILICKAEKQICWFLFKHTLCKLN